METASTLDSTDSSGLKVSIHNKSQNNYFDTLLLLTVCSSLIKEGYHTYGSPVGW